MTNKSELLGRTLQSEQGKTHQLEALIAEMRSRAHESNASLADQVATTQHMVLIVVYMDFRCCYGCCQV